MYLPVRKIRHQVLLLFALVMLGAMLILGVFAGFRMRQALTNQLTGNQKAMGKVIMQGIANHFDLIFQELEKLSKDPCLLSVSDKTRFLLSGYIAANPLFVNAIVYGVDGTVQVAAERAGSSDSSYLIGKNLLRSEKNLSGLRDSLENTIKNNRIQVSSLFSSIRQGKMLVVNLPVRAPDLPSHVLRVLSMGIHLDGVLLHEMLSRYGVGDGFIILTDRDGRILAQHGADLPAGLSKAVIDKPPENGTAASTWTMLSGREYLLTALRFPHIEGVLLLGKTRASIFATINAMALDMLVLALIPLVMAGLLAWFLADRYIRQILDLLHGLRQMAAGVFSTRIQVSSDDELGEAGMAFNAMADELERNHLVEELWHERWNRPQ